MDCQGIHTSDRAETLEAFWKKRSDVDDRYVAVRYRENDRLKYDLSLIKQYCDQDSVVLDLGCGTGLIEDLLAASVRHIDAVDKTESFIERTSPLENVSYCISDAAAFFMSDVKYDLIIMFGLACYLTDDELLTTLENCIEMLSYDGVIIIKGQWGVSKRKTVHGYSDELDSLYYADYRSIEEMRSLAEVLHAHLEVIECYPPSFSRWPDTHEYALLIQKACENGCSVG